VLEFALVAFGAAAVVAAGLTPIARRVALMVDLVAEVRPDRVHTAPRPYGGGIAIADTLTLVVGGAWLIGLYGPAGWLPDWLPEGVRSHLAARTPVLVRLAFGAIVFFIIGLVDDRYNLPALPKLLMQAFGATLVVVGFGLGATAWIEPAWLAQTVSILWILAVVNAYNMVDHADGLAAAVGAVAFGALAAGQMMVGEWFVPGVALAVAGALVGFLLHNLPPAKLFMGDAGSHLVGYLFAVLAMVARYYHPAAGTTRWVVLAPVVILLVPLADMVCVSLGRLRRGQSPMQGDATSHLGHRLLARGWTPRSALIVVSALAVAGAVASVLLYEPGWASGAGLLAGSAVVAALVWLRRVPRGEVGP